MSPQGNRAIGQTTDVTLGRIVRTWWPLAASWLLMALEGPAIALVVARMADPKIHLAAYGGLVFPLALMIEAPIVMLLAASTALSKDWPAYRKIRRVMHLTSAALTALHLVIVLTPAYGILARNVINAPEEILEPARLGLLIMLPWTWSIAYRRFNQGVLIRFGHSISVGVGTVIRLTANASVLLAGFLTQSFSGIVVATAATSAGVLAEAAYVALRVRPVLRMELPQDAEEGEPLSYRGFFRFYVPLSLTSIVLLGARPILSAGISRMPNAIDSLAVLPVITGLTFLLRSVGVAYSEVVIAYLDHPGSTRPLRRFSQIMMAATTAGLVLIAATPLAGLWFGTVTGLEPHLVEMARTGLLFAVILPALSVAQSWTQGIILQSKKTRSITEAIFIYLAVSTAILWVGVAIGRIDGIYVGMLAMTLGEGLRNLWLWLRSRRARNDLCERDRQFAAPRSP